MASSESSYEIYLEIGQKKVFAVAVNWPGWCCFGKMETINERKDRVRREVIQGLQVAAAGQLPREGSQGGKRWSPRFFVRRLAWHAVDHAWEIEDRKIC